MWSSAAVAHLLQGFMCCLFRDGSLHIFVVTSVYMSYCCCSITSNQSAHSPLTSTTGYFLSLGPFSVNPSEVVVKTPVNQQLLKDSEQQP